MNTTTDVRHRPSLITYAILSLTLAGFAGCEEEVTSPDDNTIQDAVGLVVEGEFSRYVIYRAGIEVPLAPVNLPEPFQQDSLRVVFSGTILLPSPNVRMNAAPIKLTEIRRYRGE